MIERVNDLIDLIVLRQALNNPRSSTELNNWMDEKLDNRMAYDMQTGEAIPYNANFMKPTTAPRA